MNMAVVTVELQVRVFCSSKTEFFYNFVFASIYKTKIYLLNDVQY